MSLSEKLRIVVLTAFWYPYFLFKTLSFKRAYACASGIAYLHIMKIHLKKLFEAMHKMSKKADIKNEPFDDCL